MKPGVVGTKRGSDQDSVVGEDTMELEQPGFPSVHQMGEHRPRPDDVEVAVLER